MKKTLSTVAVMALLLPMSGFSGTIGDWETGLDNWDDNLSGVTLLGGQTEGVTLGSGSLLVDGISGYTQGLRLTLDPAQKADFMANSTFSMDVSVASTAGITAGYSQVAQVFMNSGDAGWQQVSTANPVVQFGWWPDRPDETQTVEIDYTSYRDQITTVDYIQIIFALNAGGGAPQQMYFDNAQLVPEPSTIGLLGISGVGLFMVRRKYKA